MASPKKDEYMRGYSDGFKDAGLMREALEAVCCGKRLRPSMRKVFLKCHLADVFDADRQPERI